MASNITTTNIDVTYPIPGVDNDTQGFRDNFSAIKNALDTAKDEIETVQITQANLLKFASTEPASPVGVSSDTIGTIHANSTTLYICFQDYVNTTTSIWGKISIDSTSW